MKVIGAGFGRTGTKSLQLALQMLGFNKCYHMEELMRNPHGVKHWQDAYDEKDVDWDSLFEGYQAIVDFPGAIYYQRIAARYPSAKIILTVRDPQQWYESLMKTIYTFDPPASTKIKMLLKMPFSATARNFFKVIMLNKKSIWGKFFESKVKDRDYMLKRFEEHIEEAKQNFPADRLLIFDVSEGWEPLCLFLNC